MDEVALSSEVMARRVADRVPLRAIEPIVDDIDALAEAVIAIGDLGVYADGLEKGACRALAHIGRKLADHARSARDGLESAFKAVDRRP